MAKLDSYIKAAKHFKLNKSGPMLYTFLEHNFIPITREWF